LLTDKVNYWKQFAPIAKPLPHSNENHWWKPSKSFTRTKAKPGASDVKVVQYPLAGVVDIVAFKEYVGLPPDCATARWEIPYDKPVFVSEFGGDARQGFHGDKAQRWTEEFQEELYRQTLPMLDQWTDWPVFHRGF
jgi:hypothetical protein